MLLHEGASADDGPADASHLDAKDLFEPEPLPFPGMAAVTDPSVAPREPHLLARVRLPALAVLAVAAGAAVALAFLARPGDPSPSALGSAGAGDERTIPDLVADDRSAGGIESAATTVVDGLNPSASSSPAPRPDDATPDGAAPGATPPRSSTTVDADATTGAEPAQVDRSDSRSTTSEARVPSLPSPGPTTSTSRPRAATTATPTTVRTSRSTAATTRVAPTAPSSTSTPTSTSTTTTAGAALPQRIVGIGGFERGPQAGPSAALRHRSGTEMGSWDVVRTVHREDLGLHGRTPGSGHVLNVGRSGRVTRSVDGLVAGQRYQLVVKANHHVDGPTNSVVAATVTADGRTVTIMPTRRSDVPFDRHTVEFVASGPEVVVTLAGVRATDACCGVVFDSVSIEAIGP